MSDEISPELEAATVAFHAALDAHGGLRNGHSYESEFVDGNSYLVVEALLAAGWTPPELAEPSSATGPDASSSAPASLSRHALTCAIAVSGACDCVGLCAVKERP